MPFLFGLYQNAFVPVGLLADSCLLVHELLSFLKNKRQEPTFATIKLDKEWDFIEGALRHVDFLELWIWLIVDRIAMVAYPTLINGVLFTPTLAFRRHLPKRSSITLYFYFIHGSVI